MSNAFPQHRRKGLAAARPGELVHYFANLLTLFRDTRSLCEIDELAHAALALRERRIEQFDDRLSAALTVVRGASRPRAHLAGWDLARIQQLRACHGGLLLALFHYGEHRHLLADLCCLGLPVVAPIAKLSQFHARALVASVPADCAMAPQLLEVENHGVGRSLLTALRSGRVGVIYADGNMGPDGQRVEESAVEVDFLGQRIRVKCGIARLAQALRLPVLPLLAVADANDPARAHSVRMSAEILPDGSARSREAATRRIMQDCYDTLAAEVAAAPQHWEFAYCLHRWLRPVSTSEDVVPAAQLTEAHWLKIDHSLVVAYPPQHDGVYWLHVGRQRAYRLPAWSVDLYPVLTAQSLPLHEVIAHCSRRAASTVDAARLLEELHRNGLIQVVAS
jgi:lauroyl/myristoyl acyltransferase